MFFSSPGNTLDIHLALLEELNCNIFLKPKPISAIALDVSSRRSMKTLELPHIDEWLHDLDDGVKLYSYMKTYEEARYDPFAVLHSSGTTGAPKIIVLRQGTMATYDAIQSITSLGENSWLGDYWKGNRVFCSFPWFHAAGLLFFIPIAFYGGAIPVIVPSAREINAKRVDMVHQHGNVQASLLSPSLLVTISRDTLMLDNLRCLKMITVAGGPLPEAVGDLITTKSRLNGAFGSTEVGFLPGEVPSKEDWQYYKFSSFSGHEFRYFGDDLYELFIVRRKELEPFQAVFFNFPDYEEYSMKDIYTKHPVKEGWWRPSGRADDVVVLLDARKLNPRLKESMIESHPSVSAALICGQARSQPALLIQPTIPIKNKLEKEKMLSDIWPAVEQANLLGPSAGKIVLTKDLTMFTTAEKPMSRASGKHTIQRKRTLDLYQEELNELYLTAARTANGSH